MVGWAYCWLWTKGVLSGSGEGAGVLSGSDAVIIMIFSAWVLVAPSIYL